MRGIAGDLLKKSEKLLRKENNIEQTEISIIAEL